MKEKIKEGYDRVTHILSQWDKFGVIDKDVLEHKIWVGTEVHQAIDNHLDCLPNVIEDEEAEQYFNSFLSWYEHSDLSIIARSQRYYDDAHMITGEIDALVKEAGSDSLIIYDWKTSSTKDDLSWALQGCFYRYLLTKNGQETLSETVRFVKLDKVGKAKVYSYECTDELWDVCKAAITTYRYQKPWLEKRKIGERL